MSQHLTGGLQDGKRSLLKDRLLAYFICGILHPYVSFPHVCGSCISFHRSCVFRIPISRSGTRVAQIEKQHICDEILCLLHCDY